MNPDRSTEQILDLRAQGLAERRTLVIEHGALAGLGFRYLRLVQLHSLSRHSSDHVLLGESRPCRPAHAKDGFAGCIAALSFGFHRALEGALVLNLFRVGIILLWNKARFSFVTATPGISLTILCVDDATLVGDAMAHVLTTAGNRVERATTEAEAWKKIREPNSRRFDVVVLDHDTTGFSTLIFARSLRQANFVGRIIVYGGAIAAAERQQFPALTVELVVVPGPDSEKLLRIVETVCGRSA